MTSSKNDKLNELLSRLQMNVNESAPTLIPARQTSETTNSATNSVRPILQSVFKEEIVGSGSQSVNQQNGVDSLGGHNTFLQNETHVPKHQREGPNGNRNGPIRNGTKEKKNHYKKEHVHGYKAKEIRPQVDAEVLNLTKNGVMANVKVEQQPSGGEIGPSASVVSPLAALFSKFQADRDAEAQLQAQELEKLKQTEVEAAAKKDFNRKNVPRKILEQMRKLPIYSSKNKLIELLQNNQMVVVMGETGSGKSTQIPQYLVEAGFSTSGKIGITQPRRVAAKALAERVSIECGVKVGTRVGYAVRFDKCVSGNTIIKYMTDGMLVKEFSQEPLLEAYSVIIIDEAHERSIHTDICFGLLKRAAISRPDLKIIISSATLDSQKISAYFNNAPILKVPGKGYDVELVYETVPFGDYIQRSVDTVFRIHRHEPRGDVLVFLTGQDEIDYVWELLESGMTLRGLNPSELLILPCCGALPFEDQQKIFEEPPVGCRKIVLATNIAETSITIDGIVYVVDCGHFKQNNYNARTGIDSLLKIQITKFQAIQRAGRAGRTRAGKCFRLYTEKEYLSFKQAAIPEIQRGNVESVVLDLLSMGIKNILEFDFMDSPSMEALMGALEQLKWPGCSDEVLTIVSLLSTQYQNIFNRAKKKRALADAKKAYFNDSEGDHFTLLKVYNEWGRNNFREDWCRFNCVQFRSLCEAFEVRQELRDILLSHNLDEVSCGPRKECIQKAFAAGYFRRVARKKQLGHAYETLPLTSILTRDDVFLHPSSALFHIKPHPQWIIFHEVMKTSKAYIRGAIIIKHEWIKEYAPDFAKKLSETYGISF
ncbi:ATP-dependent RNA helicase DHX8 [Orchesella cincta]|uniref:RNA helicase n=1 Tax=Orchesella cincta TaxID=48709 RepID=A0A1D2MRV2_ORCCI|nr:ATP-dependent RNA helicase DHX8 [Orchesella cincta]